MMHMLKRWTKKFSRRKAAGGSLWRLTFATLAFSFAACGSHQYLVRSTPQGVTFNRIAVFPFENLSEIPEASGRVTNMLVSQLNSAHIVNLVEPGEVQDFILRSRIRYASQLDLDSIRQASRQLNADGIIFGSVNEYTIITTDLGPLPAVSASLRLINADSGDIVWSQSYSLQGDFKETFFGIGRVNSLAMLSEIIVQNMVDDLRVAISEAARPPKPIEATSVEAEKQGDIQGEPVLPPAPNRPDAREAESEREKARSNTQQEWESIKNLSQ
jgi:TolB-like protein